jgi:hypothetical protein
MLVSKAEKLGTHTRQANQKQLLHMENFIRKQIIRRPSLLLYKVKHYVGSGRPNYWVTPGSALDDLIMREWARLGFDTEAVEGVHFAVLGTTVNVPVSYFKKFESINDQLNEAVLSGKALDAAKLIESL